MFLGNNIRLIRKKWRYKQDQFGAKFNVQGQSISTYEKGTAEPRLAFLLKLSEMTGVSINDLCGKPLHESKIPEKPFYAPQAAMPLVVSEPGPNYDLLQPEDIAEPLYNMHILVAEVKKMRNRLEELEKSLGVAQSDSEAGA